MNKPVASAEKEIAAALRLRQDPVPVTRLSRKVLIGLGAIGSIAIVGAVAWAMGDHGGRSAKPELYATGGKATPDGLAALPRDYATTSSVAPKLGPPLPGDLGRPMLSASEAGGPLAAPSGAASAPQPDPVQQQLAQEGDSARTSRLFAGDANGAGGASAPALVASASLPSPGVESAAAPGGASTPQDRKLAFMSGQADQRTASAERLQAPSSPDVVQAGSVIPAVLITGVRSDLPGQVIAQVSQNVYDSPTGRILLIPQGSKLIGTYDSQIAFGQRRVLLAWTRLILPGGRSIVLERQPAADPQGYAGLEDRVNNHWGQLVSAALISTLLGAGADIGVSQSSGSDLVQAFRFGFANNINQAGQQVVGRSLQVQPTLTIRPGSPVRVMVTRDLVLDPFPA